jgi:pimeloyl-ACP methyl ester carboxylesterase
MKRARLVPEESLPRLPDLVPAWPGDLTMIDGSATFVRRIPATTPTAEPALYVHGLGGSSSNWTDLAYVLRDRVDADAIDLPGFGLSDPGRRYGVADAAARVIRWISKAGRGPVHLFGNSLGGAISVWVAAQRPDLVRTLTLISPAMPFLDPRRSVHSRLVPLLFLPGAEHVATRRLATLGPAEVARQAIASCFYDPAQVHPDRLAEAIEEVRQRHHAPWYAAAYLRSLRGLVGSFVRAYLPGENSMWRVATRITAPTLVIVGRQDRIVDLRVAPAVARAIPDSRLLVLDRVGHVAQMERPVVVARAFAGMQDEVRAGPAPHQAGAGSAGGEAVISSSGGIQVTGSPRPTLSPIMSSCASPPTIARPLLATLSRVAAPSSWRALRASPVLRFVGTRSAWWSLSPRWLSSPRAVRRSPRP